MQAIIDLYTAWAGAEPVKVEALPKAGSNRQYFRLYSPENVSPKTVIGAYGTSVEENDAFIYLARHFTKRRLPVPQILKVSRNKLCYLQTDLGDLSLYDALETGRKAGGKYNLQEKELLKQTIRLLPEIQIRGARGLDFSHCYPQPAFDKTNVLFDLNYFKYCFLKPLEIEFNELKLEATFQLFASDLTTDFGESFMYRDFQARNVMLDAAGKPAFIDFQGGRRGPLEYDVVSFLWQASARYAPRLRQELIDEYIKALRLYTEFNEAALRKNIKKFILFRLLQVLGAYGFRGYFEKKPYFINSIPPAIQNLREALRDDACPYPYLKNLLKRLTDLPRFKTQPVQIRPRKDGYRTTESQLFKPDPYDGPATFSKYDGRGPLTVRIFSFSFHKGIPEDTSGNGGGYVFDCRSTHNPGRYEPYKQLTGLDEPVVRFLENDGEILDFLADVFHMAERHVERYLERGFTDLMFSFGCTGGQHRSVYSAERLAEHLNSKYGIRVVVTHREQGITHILEAKEQKKQ